MVELIEAAVRAGTPELAADARSRLAEMARVSGTDWALGVAARSEALLRRRSASRGALSSRRSIASAGRGWRVDLARAHLLYGEWLRRQRRRIDAREAAADGARPLLRLRDGGVRRARTRRVGGDRRACSQTHRRHARPTDAAGGADLAPRRRRETRTERSPLSCSSARARSSTTCARRSASSA